MKKLILSLLMITMLTGCVSAPVKQEEVTTTKEDVVTTVETTVKTTTEINLPVSFEEVVKAELEQNPDIIGGMFADLNSDGIDEVVFSVDTPMGIMYTINYFVNNELIKTGEIYYFGYWMNKEEISPEIRVYSDNGISFYCAEKTYSIKDVASVNGVEITAYYQMDGAPLPCDVNVITYQMKYFSIVIFLLSDALCPVSTSALSVRKSSLRKLFSAPTRKSSKWIKHLSVLKTI